MSIKSGVRPFWGFSHNGVSSILSGVMSIFEWGYVHNNQGLVHFGVMSISGFGPFWGYVQNGVISIFEKSWMST